ncbi:MAG TPA: tetratricopeptide repeat protein, partial [Bryobacteraceae bacterium]|nr:tetratricopeptide repeat protein [Bryobacteraceae bacterium]
MRSVLIIAAAASSLWAQTAQDCRALDRGGKRAQAQACFEKQTQSANPGIRAEGLWGLGRYQDANSQFKLAVAAQPKNPDLRVRWGRLFLERFVINDAQKLFEEALEIKETHAPALLGMALIASEGFDQKAVEFANKALESDPKLVEAQELLAKLALEDNNIEGAIKEADKAIAMSPGALDAMAVRAAADRLQLKPTTEWLDRILKLNPSYGQAYATVGHFLVLNRRYEEGIEAYRKALELDPSLHAARSELGINLMRLGEEKEAYEQLSKAFEAGHQDNATKNSLVLMDSYKNFLTFATPSTIVKVHKKEADLLKPYIERELQRAVSTYEKKYKMKLDRPVQVEVYPDHEDFAVRTLGMPGLGALGVAFGYVVAMDSPSGRRPGTFHWASTLWHELSHVYVLTATKHRVPRWFTEGMAVHEETATSPDWGDRLDPEAIRAIKDKKLLPVAELDRGFIRPKYPSQVIVSYFQAGRICDYIAKKWGYDKLLAMMHAFGEGKSTPEVIESQLGVKPEDFDTEFLAALEAQTKKTVDGFAEWRKKMKALDAKVASGAHDDVIKDGRELIDLYPDFVEQGNAYEMVAKALEAKGDTAGATEVLKRYSTVGGRNPQLLMKLAAQQEAAGDKRGAIATLSRIIYIYPLEEALHKKLGDLYLAEGNTAEA